MQPPFPLTTNIAPSITTPHVWDDEEVEWMGYESAYPLPTVLGIHWIQEEVQNSCSAEIAMRRLALQRAG